jgi:uncharacterized protein YoxC
MTHKELEEENARLTRDLNNMVRCYAVMEAEVQKLTQERDGLLDTVERLSLDLAVKDGHVHFQD